MPTMSHLLQKNHIFFVEWHIWRPWERLAEIFPWVGKRRERRERKKTSVLYWAPPRRRLSRPVLALVGDVTIYGVRFLC